MSTDNTTFDGAEVNGATQSQPFGEADGINLATPNTDLAGLDPPAAPAAPLPMTEAEVEDLARHEEAIERGMRAYYETGFALSEIRDRRLYRHDYKTFEAYVSSRWSLSRPQAYRLIEAAEVAKNLSPMGDIPTNERQARPLTDLSPDQQREAWAETLERTKGRPTAAVVHKVVAERWPKPKPKPKSPTKTTTKDAAPALKDGREGEDWAGFAGQEKVIGAGFTGMEELIGAGFAGLEGGDGAGFAGQEVKDVMPPAEAGHEAATNSQDTGIGQEQDHPTISSITSLDVSPRGHTSIDSPPPQEQAGTDSPPDNGPRTDEDHPAAQSPAKQPQGDDLEPAAPAKAAGNQAVQPQKDGNRLTSPAEAASKDISVIPPAEKSQDNGLEPAQNLSPSQQLVSTAEKCWADLQNLGNVIVTGGGLSEVVSDLDNKDRKQVIYCFKCVITSARLLIETVMNAEKRSP